MPTKTTSTNTAQFDPNSMNAYQGAISGGMGVLNQDIANPMSQIGFNQRIAMGNSQLFNSFQRNNSSLAQRAGAFGGATPLFLQNQLAQNQRSLSSGQANLFNQNLLYADQVRQGAASQMMNFRPLQTGSTTTQAQSGVGTWLGPIASAGIGAATMGMGGFGGGGGFGQSSGNYNLGPSTGAMSQNSWNAYQGSVGNNNSFIGNMNTSAPANNAWLNNG